MSKIHQTCRRISCMKARTACSTLVPRTGGSFEYRLRTGIGARSRSCHHTSRHHGRHWGILGMLPAVIVSLKGRSTRLISRCPICRTRPRVLPKPKSIFDALATSGSRSKTRWFDEQNSSKSDSLMVFVLLTVNQVLKRPNVQNNRRCAALLRTVGLTAALGL